MSRKRQQNPRPAILGLSLRWLPVLALPFGVLFAETWMQLEHYHLDYLTNKLGADIRQLKDDVKELVASKANLETMERLDDMAPRLGLKRPSHSQIVIVRVPGGTSPSDEDASLQYARLKNAEATRQPVSHSTGE